MPDASPIATTAASSTPSLRPDGPGRRSRLQRIYSGLQLLNDPFGTVMRRFKRYGDVYWVDQPDGRPLYVIRHPDHIKDVLVTNAAAFDKQHVAFHRLSRVLGDALLTSDGERWRRQRRLVQPAFARSRLVQYSAAMVEEAALSAEQLARGGTAVDVSLAFNQLTLRIVSRTLFGQGVDERGDTQRAMLDLNHWFGTPDFVTRFVPGRAARYERVISTLDGIIEGLIANKRAAQPVEAQPAEASTDLLSALMTARDEDGEHLEPRELRDQLLTLYLAGHETTSHALTWTLYLLSQNPDVAARLADEHARVLGGRLPTFEDVAALTYTEQVIKEALRLYPPAFILPRSTREATMVGPYQLPKDSDVVIWIYVVHRDPRWYPEPNEFRPERFEPQAEAARPKYAYLPFGAGQRACIGQMFAMLEAQLILATLLPKLSFEFAGKRRPRLRTGLTLAPKGGLPMLVRKR
ncbi:MAG TPA: cytochrome P450 [Polyangiales bacterium]|nr:cytochrome P450 [Polyangiales bacterium]